MDLLCVHLLLRWCKKNFFYWTVFWEGQWSWQVMIFQDWIFTSWQKRDSGPCSEIPCSADNKMWQWPMLRDTMQCWQQNVHLFGTTKRQWLFSDASSFLSKCSSVWNNRQRDNDYLVMQVLFCQNVHLFGTTKREWLFSDAGSSVSKCSLHFLHLILQDQSLGKHH